MTTKRKARNDTYIPSMKMKSVQDRNEHSSLEVRFKELYGKWPSTAELIQARSFLKKRADYDKE